MAVDIGANVGDTLAIIARHSALDVICVEPSDFYLPYLRHNVTRHFAGRARVLDWFVTARDDEPGRALFHWGGTAKAINQSYSESGTVASIGRLIADAGEVALLKIDTDGADLSIIEGCLDAHQPTFPIYFELEKTNPKPDKVGAFCAQAQRFFSRVVAAGYRQAFVWDDPGRFYGRLDLSADMTVKNLLNYLTQLRHRPIWGYDICLVHDSDTALSKQLSALISEDQFVPLD
ncbi:FkbM family methyltransferase [Nocardia sp. NPDC005998]|uniref:FkbM family methyltransferase n=1 Tax=Nocardia sp. NPDC005998 TaxID=3156894 RepID=UPI0033AB0764